MIEVEEERGQRATRDFLPGRALLLLLEPLQPLLALPCHPGATMSRLARLPPGVCPRAVRPHRELSTWAPQRSRLPSYPTFPARPAVRSSSGRLPQQRLFCDFAHTTPQQRTPGQKAMSFGRGLVKWVMIGGGCVFWGSLVVESSLLGTESFQEMLEREEAEDRRQATFYGLMSEMLDPGLPDSAYFAEVWPAVCRRLLLLRTESRSESADCCCERHASFRPCAGRQEREGPSRAVRPAADVLPRVRTPRWAA